MLVLMPIPRVHAVEEMGWQSEDPISFFQALLPTYSFTVCRTHHFSMPHLLPHKSMTAFHRWELPYTSTNYFHLFNFKQLQDIYPECQEHRETLRQACECFAIVESEKLMFLKWNSLPSSRQSHTSVCMLAAHTTEMTHPVLKEPVCYTERENT